MGRNAFTPTEVQERQAATGVFLPPEVNGEGYDPAPVHSERITETEEKLYLWIKDKLEKTPGGLTIFDDLAIREAAEATVYYYRIKNKADLAPLLVNGKPNPLQGLLKNAQVRKNKAYDAIGLNPAARSGMRTSGFTKHKRPADEVYSDDEDALDSLLDATES